MGSESMGETRPGERILRGSILPTKFNPDLEFSGELGREFEEGLEKESRFLLSVLAMITEFSGLGG